MQIVSNWLNVLLTLKVNGANITKLSDICVASIPFCYIMKGFGDVHSTREAFCFDML